MSKLTRVIEQFGFKTKSLYQYFVDLDIVKTRSVVKNRMDLFDPFCLLKRLVAKEDAYILKSIDR